MDNQLCSKTFRDFWNKASSITCRPPELEKAFSIMVAPVAKELGIAKIELELHTNVNPIEKQATNAVYVLYDRDCAMEGPSSFSFDAEGKSRADIRIHPVKGNTFSPNTLSELHFLASIIFTLLSRFRLLDLVHSASSTDYLTGVTNQAGFLEFGHKKQAENLLSNYTAIFINLKNFRYVNKLVTQECGNRVLQIYAQSALKFLQKDEIFSRLGGDNFIALVKNERLNSFLNKFVIFPINETYGEKKLVVQLMARMGIYAGTKSDSLEDMMTHCSIAHAIGKNALNKDITFFKPEMMTKIMHEKQILNIFPEALKNGDFIVHYQPKINLYDKKICGAETLVRWKTADKLIQPTEFIPILEKEGPIEKLDLYVFEKLCQDIRDWLDAGLNVVRISSNFSKQNLRNPNMVEDILSIMKKYAIDSKYIEIELTEISDYDDYKNLVSVITKLKMHGIAVSIDDFGTGYSTIKALKDLNVDVIKIDKSLIDNLEKQKMQDEIVIKNIVNMINELSIETIAEGVETQTQVNFLKRIHCSLVQGFLYDKPLPHDDFEKRLKEPHYYEDK